MQYRTSASHPSSLFSSPRQKRIVIWTARHELFNAATAQGMINIDCGSKTGYPMFRPSPNLYLTMQQSEGQYDEEWFAQQYLKELEERAAKHHRDWLGILDSKRIVVTCEHAVDHKLAHRHIVRTFLCQFAIENDYKLLHGGEIRWKDNSKKELLYTDW